MVFLHVLRLHLHPLYLDTQFLQFHFQLFPLHVEFCLQCLDFLLLGECLALFEHLLAFVFLFFLEEFPFMGHLLLLQGMVLFAAVLLHLALVVDFLQLKLFLTLAVGQLTLLFDDFRLVTHMDALLLNLFLSLNGVGLSLQPDCVAKLRLHIVEQGLRKDSHVLDLDGLHHDAPLFADIFQFLLQLQDDGTAFAEHLFDGHVGYHVTDGRFHDILQEDAHLLHRIVVLLEVETLIDFLGVTHFPDGKSADLDTLILTAYLVGREGDVIHFSRDNHILNERSAKESEATAFLHDVAFLENDGVVGWVDCHKTVVTHVFDTLVRVGHNF